MCTFPPHAPQEDWASPSAEFTMGRTSRRNGWNPQWTERAKASYLAPYLRQRSGRGSGWPRPKVITHGAVNGMRCSSVMSEDNQTSLYKPKMARCARTCILRPASPNFPEFQAFGYKKPPQLPSRPTLHSRLQERGAHAPPEPLAPAGRASRRAPGGLGREHRPHS